MQCPLWVIRGHGDKLFLVARAFADKFGLCMDYLDVYVPNPGSPEAVPLGCICPPIQHGPRFTVHARCPLHGFETVRAMFQLRPLDQMAAT